MSDWYNNKVPDDIWYSDAFSSREEAIEDGIEQYKMALDGYSTDLFDDRDQDDAIPTTFYVGKGVPFIPFVGVDEVIEQVANDAYWECGDIAEDFLSWRYLEKGWIDELQEGFQKEFDAWLKKHSLYPSFFHIEETEKIYVKDYL